MLYKLGTNQKVFIDPTRKLTDTEKLGLDERYEPGNISQINLNGMFSIAHRSQIQTRKQKDSAFLLTK